MTEYLFDPLPADLQKAYEEYDRQGLGHMNAQRWAEAIQVYQQSHRILLSRQPPAKRHHKGGPLYFLGVCHAFGGQKAEAMQYFLLAYIEDLLSEPHAQINIAETRAAAKNLRQCGVEERLLDVVKATALQKKSRGEVVQEPIAILAEALESRGGIGVLQTLSQGFPAGFLKRPVDVLETPWVNRVFVGGNYNFPATLMEIKKAIVEAGCDPILAIEFAMPEDMIHHHTLMLLHTCKRAVFDISADGGHLVEIERLRDYQIDPLLVFPHFPGDDSPPKVSAMLKTMGYATYPYHEMRILRELVLDYLTGMGMRAQR